jgi:hypothetical protein
MIVVLDACWTGFGMHVWTLLVQFLIPKKTFNHFDYFWTDLFMLGQICLCMFEQIWTGFGMHVLVRMS